MSVIKPFRGLRPRPEVAHEVASPPYDVLSSDEARALVAENPNSFLRVNKPEVDFPAETDPHGETIYRRGKENLGRLVADGLMFRDETPCFYLYRLTWQGRSQTGLVALTSTDEYDKGLIKNVLQPAQIVGRQRQFIKLLTRLGAGDQAQPGVGGPIPG